jgi:hypothetical protein
MGIGFVLLVWLVLSMVGALCASIGLGFATWRFLRRSAKGPRRRAIVATVALPPLAVVSAFAGFVGYGIWCETVRGVDAGLGDSWRVPLGSGYSLQMIDTPEQAHVETPTGYDVGLEVRRLGFDDRFIYLETPTGRYLLLDKETGHSTSGLTRQTLDAKLKESGAFPATLRSSEDVYLDLRWGIQDVLAGLFILALPTLLTLMVLLYVIKVRRSGQSVAACIP